MEGFFEAAGGTDTDAQIYKIDQSKVEAILFKDNFTTTYGHFTPTELHFQLLKHKKREVDLTLHGVTLSEYYREKKIPRGFRIKNVPTIGRTNANFCKKWIGVLNQCSLDLMILVVEEINKELSQFSGSTTTTAGKNMSESEEIRNPEITENVRHRVKSHILVKNIKDLQRCPWTLNPKYHTQIRSELKACCNANDGLLVTQNNTQIGKELVYETEKAKKIKVNEILYKMLPEVSPFTDKPYKRCAVVGNGGILLNSCCGSEINRADFVFRLNLPPMEYSYDTGKKTDAVTANPSILINSFSRLNERRRPFFNKMKAYGSALILMPAFSYKYNTDVSFKVFFALEDFGSSQKVVFFHPNYLKNLGLYWKKRGLKVKRLSSGLMLVSAALELCEKVTLYGFWPFGQDPEGNPIPHHYYDNKIPKPGFHSMPDEFFFYAQMHSQGVLRVQAGKCV
ncbi:alpha-2,8-sialyltransferase 8E-like [Rhinophrynus dorsalis]